MKELFIIISMLAFTNIGLSQNSILIGSVTDTSKTQLPFVNIIIKGADSIRLGTISDIKGSFEFSNIEPQQYKLLVSCLGFQIYKANVEIKKNDTLNLNIILHSTSHNLSEVVVQGKLIEQYADKNIYNITTQEKKGVTSAFGILKLLPKINLDPVNKTISTTNGKMVKLLINGINATINDFLTLNPENIAKVEFFDIVPARFASEDLGAVINIITKQAIQGGEFFANLTSALTTWFSDDALSFKYNKNNNQFSINYNLSLRNYHKSNSQQSFDYIKNNDTITKTEKGARPFYYYINVIDFKFINSKTERHTLSIDATMEYYNDWSQQKQNIFLNNILYNQYSLSTQKSSYLNPNINMYYNYSLPKKQELTLNFVATYFNNKYNTDLFQKKFNNDYNIYSSNSNIIGNKYSFISEVLYTKVLKSFNFNLGIKASEALSTQLNNKIKSTSDLSNTYIFSEITGNFNKFNYLLGIGNKFDKFQSKELNIEYNTSNIKPKLRIGYNISEFSNIKFTSSFSNYSPSLSDLSANMVYIDSMFAYSGNPNLKPYIGVENSLEFAYSKPKFQFFQSLNYNYCDHPILPFYELINNINISTQTNFIWSKSYSSISGIKIVPFKKQWIDLNLQEIITYAENKKTQLNYMYFNYLSSSINIYYKKFTFSGAYQSPYNNLYGELIMKNSSVSYCNIQYSYKNFNFSIGMYYPFSKSWHSEGISVKSSILKYSFINDIYDNGKMLFFNLVYNFNFGRKVNEVEQKIYNQDKDTGIFKK